MSAVEVHLGLKALKKNIVVLIHDINLDQDSTILEEPGLITLV